MLNAVNVSKKYKVDNVGIKKTYFTAVKNVSVEFEENKIYVLVGESGCGKSTLARMLSYIENTSSGKIILDGKSINDYKPKELMAKRNVVQLVMQDAVSSLDPRQTISQILDEPLKILIKMPKNEREKRKIELLEMVKLPKNVLTKLPNQLSGGQQKRICIARALSVSPKLIIFDESFSGLDVTIKKQILDLLKELKTNLSLSYLIITHDLDIAVYMADEILVMKSGQIIENVNKKISLKAFKSPYALELVEALLTKRKFLNKK